MSPPKVNDTSCASRRGAGHVVNGLDRSASPPPARAQLLRRVSGECGSFAQGGLREHRIASTMIVRCVSRRLPFSIAVSMDVTAIDRKTQFRDRITATIRSTKWDGDRPLDACMPPSTRRACMRMGHVEIYQQAVCEFTMSRIIAGNSGPGCSLLSTVMRTRHSRASTHTR